MILTEKLKVKMNFKGNNFIPVMIIQTKLSRNNLKYKWKINIKILLNNNKNKYAIIAIIAEKQKVIEDQFIHNRKKLEKCISHNNLIKPV